MVRIIYNMCFPVCRSPPESFLFIQFEEMIYTVGGIDMINYEVQFGLHPVKVGQQFRVKTVYFSGDNAFEKSLRFFDKVIRMAERSKSTWTISLWERYYTGAPKRWLVKSETINPSSIIG